MAMALLETIFFVLVLVLSGAIRPSVGFIVSPSPGRKTLPGGPSGSSSSSRTGRPAASREDADDEESTGQGGGSWRNDGGDGEYWFRQDIHTLGNTGLGGGLHAAVAPLSTRLIDLVAYHGTDVRTTVSE